MAATAQITSQFLAHGSLCHWGNWSSILIRNTSRKMADNRHLHNLKLPVGSCIYMKHGSADSPNGQANHPTGDAQHRRAVKVGSEVDIVLKKDQSTNKLTRGIVQDLLTNSGTHPRGIKVRLRGGAVGRVQSLVPHSRDTNSLPLQRDTNVRLKGDASSAFAGLSGLRRQLNASGCEHVTKGTPEQPKEFQAPRESARENVIEPEPEQAIPSKRVQTEGINIFAAHSGFLSSRSILEMAIDEGFRDSKNEQV